MGERVENTLWGFMVEGADPVWGVFVHRADPVLYLHPPVNQSVVEQGAALASGAPDPDSWIALLPGSVATWLHQQPPPRRIAVFRAAQVFHLATE